MTASNLIMEKLDEIKELTNSELALIDQLSVKVLPDKVVNQSERLKGAFINPVTSANGLPKYLAIRLEAINEILKEIQTNWNSTLPEATTHIDTIQSKLYELYSGVNDEYNTLLKIENAIKKEISDRQTAITNLINGASEDFNTLKEIETKVKQEISDREQAITNLINGASSDYDTLKELETAIKKEVSDREQAITNLINNATANYNTLGKLETRIKEETANRNSAISALKGTATSNNDTLGKLETNLNNEISNREDAIEALINNASSGYQTLKELEDKIKAEVTARTQAIAKEINDRNSAIQAAISNLVDTAPDLLNTLDELAAALGDDPNFATTVANNIAQSLTTAKAYTDTKISEEVSARNTAISGAISNLKGAATTNYDTLAKLEARIKEETTNRTSAINSLIGGATENYNTLKELEDAIKTEVTNRTEAISDLIGTASDSYNTLGKIQARIEAISGTEGEGLTIEGAITTSMDYTDEKVAEETSARNSAINSLKNGASSGYDTLKELEDAIKKEVSDRASAITQEVSDRNSAITTAINNLKGTATTGYDTLGEIESAIKAETTNRTSAITQAKTDVKNELLGGAGTAFDTLKELAAALGDDPNFATTVSNKIAQKQDKLTEAQLNAVNSGITQAKVATYDGYAAKINSKQDALSSTQQNAINSGITQAKVTKYDGYENIINSKADKSYVEDKINEISDELILSVDCDHQYEITGQTGHEYNLAIPDESNVVLREIQGQTRRKSLNLVSNVLNNQTVETTGNIYAAEGYYCSNFIQVVQGETYSFYANTYAFYSQSDGNGFVSQPYYDATDAFHSITIPSGTNHICISSNGNKNLMLVKGKYTEAEMPAFEPYNNTLVNSKANLISTNKNLLDVPKRVTFPASGSTLISYVTLPKGTYHIYVDATKENNETGFGGFALLKIPTNEIPPKTLPNWFPQGYDFLIQPKESAHELFLEEFTIDATCTIALYVGSNNKTSHINFDIFNIYYGSTAPGEYTPHLEDEVAYPELAFTDTYYPLQKKIIRHQITKTTFNGSEEDWGVEELAEKNIIYKFYDTTNGTSATDNPENLGAITNKYPLGAYGVMGTFYIAADNWFRITVPKSYTLEQFKQDLQEEPLELWYDAGNETIETYEAPSGYKVWNGGLQAQLTDDTHVPYSIIQKQYAISIAQQTANNASINVNQQAMLDNQQAMLDTFNVELKSNQSDLEHLEKRVDSHWLGYRNPALDGDSVEFSITSERFDSLYNYPTATVYFYLGTIETAATAPLILLRMSARSELSTTRTIIYDGFHGTATSSFQLITLILTKNNGNVSASLKRKSIT